MARSPVASSVSESLSSEETAMLDEQRSAPVEMEAPVQEATPEPAPAPEPAAAAAPIPPTPPVQVAAAEEGDEESSGDPAVALRMARAQAKAAEKRARELELNQATVNGRLDAINSLLQQQQAPAQTPANPAQIELPDVDTDPVGYFKARSEMAEQAIAQIMQAQQQSQSQQQAQTNVQRLLDITAAHEQQYTIDEPDYPSAASYMYQSRDRELQAMGMTDPTQRREQIKMDIATIAAQALPRGGNVASVFMNIAKERGWRPTAATTPPAPQVAAPIAPAASSAPPAANAEFERAQAALANVARGQEANQSLSQLPGSGNPAPLSVQALANMSDAQFAAKYEELKKLSGQGALRNFLETASRN